MEKKQLQFFMVSAELGSFKKAAQALYTTQSHVSKIIKTLEAEMQAELFNRSPAGVELTEEGKKVYAQAGVILQKMELLYQPKGEKPDKKLYISSVPDGRMAEIFASFCQMKKNKDIQYQFLETTAEEMLRHLHRHISEVGFLYISQSQLAEFTRQMECRKLEFIRIKKTSPCLLVGKSSPFYGLDSVEPSALGKIKLIQPEDDFYFICAAPGHKYENILAGYDGQTVISTNSNDVVMGILDNTDMGTVSCNMPPGRFGRDQLWAVPLNGMEDRVYFGYVKRKGNDLGTAAKRFIAYLVKALK